MIKKEQESLDLIEKRKKLNVFNNRQGNSNFTYDYKGKMMLVKKVNQKNLPPVVQLKSVVTNKLKLKKDKRQNEDKAKIDASMRKTNELISNAITKDTNLIERLKSARGTVDIKDENEIK